jgi:hypothetical protein
MPIEELPGEIRAVIRNESELAESYGHTDVSEELGIRVKYGRSKDGERVIACLRFNKTNGWNVDKVRKWLKDHQIQTLKKDGVLTLKPMDDFRNQELALLVGMEDVPVGQKTLHGRPVKLYDVTNNFVNNSAISEHCETKIVLCGSIIKDNVTVGPITLGVIGRRNAVLERIALEALPESMRKRARFVRLRSDKISHIPLLMSKPITDGKSVVLFEDFEDCVSAQEAKGQTHEKALEICKAIAAQDGFTAKCAQLEHDNTKHVLDCTVYAVKAINLAQEQYQYLLGIDNGVVVPIGITNPTNQLAKVGDKLRVSCNYVDVYRDPDDGRLWCDCNLAEVVECIEDYERHPADVIDELLWDEHGVKDRAEYPKAFDTRMKTGTFNNEWESHLWSIRGRQTFNESLDERMLSDESGMKPINLSRAPVLAPKTGLRWISQIHGGNDKYPTHTDLRFETENGVLSWMIFNRGLPCKCSNCTKEELMCVAHPKAPQSLGWLKPLNDTIKDNYKANGEGTYEVGFQHDDAKEFFLNAKSGPMDGVIRARVLFKRKVTENGDEWHLANPEKFMHDVFIENGMPISQLVELADQKGVTIRVIALAEGVWNGRLYPADELPKAHLLKPNAPVRINHRKGDEDVCGTVTKLWYEAEHEYNGKKIPVVMAELHVTRQDMCDKIKAGKIKAVSIGADVELEDATDGKPQVCRDITIKEISLMDNIEPACSKCVVEDKECKDKTNQSDKIAEGEK